jgi:hypothetical protein
MPVIRTGLEIFSTVVLKNRTAVVLKKKLFLEKRNYQKALANHDS